MDDVGTLALGSFYRVICRDRNWRIKWIEERHNTVVTAGLNDVLTQYFKGSAYTAAHYIGLKGAGTIAAGDIMSSHAGWSEVTDYDEANRPTYTAGTVSGGSVDNVGNEATFTMNTTVTVAGIFMTTDNTIGGTSGTLYGAVDFAAARSCISGDTLTVTVTTTAASA